MHGGGDGDDMGMGGGGSSSLKEVFGMYRTEHQREHAHGEAANEVRMREHQAAHSQEHQMREEQMREREMRLDIRLAGMNDVATAKYQAIEDRIGTLERTQAARSGMESKLEGVDARLNIVEKALAAQAGQRGGSAATISYIVLAIGALAGLIGLFTFFAGQ